MANVMNRLAACADDAAIMTELRAILCGLAGTEGRRATLDEMAAFLTATEERWTLATQTLISDLSGEAHAQFELLDTLLAWATQETVDKNDTILETLILFFQVATMRLGDAGGVQRWLQWGDQVLAVVHQNAALMEEQKPQETEEKADEGIEGLRCNVVKIASLLMQLRDKLEEDDDATPDLKMVTFVWKNLAKLATAFGPILASAAAPSAIGSSGDNIEAKDAAGEDSEKFSVDKMLADAIVSVERSVGKLLCSLDGNSTESPDIGVLKFLKLYWRAFQRLIAAFADTLECELENCVLAVVNVTASLFYAVRHSLVPITSKPGKELRGMLDQALEITTKLAGSGDGAVNNQAKESIRTLLWYPVTDMIRAVGQRQPPEITNVAMDNSIRWGHLVVLTAFTGLSLGNLSSIPDVDVPFDDLNRAVEVSQLFARFRECALNDAVSRSVEATEMFTDLMLEYLLSFDSIVELQLTLLKQTLYPDWMQRTLCWEIWRELLCFSWDESLAVQTLQMLIDITQWDDESSDKAFVLAKGMENEILQLVSFVYTDLPQSLKDMCMNQVTSVVDMLSSEGPGHPFNLRVVSQLHLLEKLSGVHFLKEYNGPMKDEWISKYLPMCFECCGTVLELLSAEAKAATVKRHNVLGMIRILDMCLLVLRAVLDDNELKHDDITELSVILVRMSTEALSQLAIQCKHAEVPQLPKRSEQLGRKRDSRNVKLAMAESRCVGRAIETSLYLLSKLSSVLKANKSNQCVQVMKDLLAIVDNTQNLSHPGAVNDTVVITARFVNTALFDVQVADDDMVIVWNLLLALFRRLFAATRTSNHQKLWLSLLLSVCLDALYELLAHSNITHLPGSLLSSLLVGDTKEAFKQCVSIRKLTPEDVAQALEIALSSTLQSLKRSQYSQYRVFRDRFRDEPADLYTDAHQVNQGASMASNKRPTDNFETLPQKRHKLTHFVSLCREIESSLSSIADDEAAENILSGTELEDATSVLHKLLAKTITLCP